MTKCDENKTFKKCRCIARDPKRRSQRRCVGRRPCLHPPETIPSINCKKLLRKMRDLGMSYAMYEIDYIRRFAGQRLPVT